MKNEVIYDFFVAGTSGKRPSTDVGGPVVSKKPKFESKEEPGAKKEENAGVAKKLQKDIRRLTRKVSWALVSFFFSITKYSLI